MTQVNEAFLRLLSLYQQTEIEFPVLRPVTVAIWLLESGRGTSALAQTYNNFAGMKWRKEMSPYAMPITYQAHDGQDSYCHFHDQLNFIRGYWVFLDRSPYNGWRQFACRPTDFIKYIGPTWAQDPNYVSKVLALLPKAEKLVSSH